MEKYLKYGLSDGNLKHISEVENGLACNCLCPNCKYPLVAKNNINNKKIAHFAHNSGKECEGAIETAIHLLAKSILQRNKQIMIPHYHFDYNEKNNKSLIKRGKLVTFEEIIIEKTVCFDSGKIIPDAIGKIRDKQVFIEFAFSHFIDADKRNFIKSNGITCIEIDLSKQAMDMDKIASLLITNSHNIYWVNNPKLDIEYKESKRKEEEIFLKKMEFTKERLRIKDSLERLIYYKKNPYYKILKAKNYEFVDCPLYKFLAKEQKADIFHSPFRQKQKLRHPKYHDCKKCKYYVEFLYPDFIATLICQYPNT